MTYVPSRRLRRNPPDATGAMNALFIERKWTRDHVRIDIEMDGTTEVGRYRFPTAPIGNGWIICSRSHENWTCWRRIHLTDVVGYFG